MCLLFVYLVKCDQLSFCYVLVDYSQVPNKWGVLIHSGVGKMQNKWGELELYKQLKMIIK